MKANLLTRAMTIALISSLTLLIPGNAMDDENKQESSWAKEYHIPGFLSPYGIIWIENLDDGVAIRGQSDEGIGLEAVSRGNGLALRTEGTSYFDGNVGIRTMNPERGLHLVGSGYTGECQMQFTDTYYGQDWHIGPGGHDFAIVETGVADRLVIERGTGYVGIGTSDPVRGLHLAGSGYTGDCQMQFTDTYDGQDWHIGPDAEGFEIVESDIASRMTVKPSTGNVGIGTQDPAYKLDVEGYVQAYGYHTGDIVFQKNGQQLWRMFEDEDGLYVENLKTGKVYSLALQEVADRK